MIKTARLSLREFHLGDADFIVELLNEPAFIANIRDAGIRNAEDACYYLTDGPLASYAQHGFGLWLVEAPGHGPIGTCGLLRREGLDDPDLGFALLERYWGRGYAREAAAAVLEFGFGELKMERILAITAPDNDASARVLESVGLRFETDLFLPDGPGQTRLFSIRKPSLLAKYVQGDP